MPAPERRCFGTYAGGGCRPSARAGLVNDEAVPVLAVGPR